MTTTQKAVRLRDALAYTGLRRTHAYDLMAEGFFPKPLKVGRTSSGSLPSLDQWLKIAPPLVLARCADERPRFEKAQGDVQRREPADKPRTGRPCSALRVGNLRCPATAMTARILKRMASRHRGNILNAGCAFSAIFPPDCTEIAAAQLRGWQLEQLHAEFPELTGALNTVAALIARRRATSLCRQIFIALIASASHVATGRAPA